MNPCGTWVMFLGWTAQENGGIAQKGEEARRPRGWKGTWDGRKRMKSSAARPDGLQGAVNSL